MEQIFATSLLQSGGGGGGGLLSRCDQGSRGSEKVKYVINEIENFFRINSDEFELARIQISEWIGIHLIGLKWISIRNFYYSHSAHTTLIKYIPTWKTKLL